MKMKGRRKMKKYILAIVTLVLSFILAGCSASMSSSIADEEAILEELKTGTMFVLDEKEVIKEIVIEKRQTDEENRTDTVWCILNTEDEEVAYQKRAVLTYGYYDDKGWLLDDVEVGSHKEWGRTPLKGVNTTNIASNISDSKLRVKIGEDSWLLDSSSIAEATVEAQNTDLEKKSDEIIVKVTLDSQVQQAVGEVVLKYSFGSSWQLTSATTNGEFIAMEKPGTGLEVAEDDLLNAINNYVFMYEPKTTSEKISYGSSSYEQTVTLDKSQVSDFVIQSKEMREKGTLIQYHCSGVLTKAHAVFSFKVEIGYFYDGEKWNFADAIFDSEVISANVLGEWKGTYKGIPRNGTTTLNITNIDENGLITGVYSWTPDEINEYSQPGSYYVSGTMDLNTLCLNLIAGEWIDEPSWALSITKQNVECALYADAGQLLGRGHEGYYFTIAQ